MTLRSPIRVRVALAAGLAVFAATLAPAGAQFGGVIDKAKRRAEAEARDAVEKSVAQTLFPLEADTAATRLTNPYLDNYAPAQFAEMTSLPRTSTGGFRLKPGAWRFTAQSYCLKAGGYERPGGAGYMSGPLTGKIAPYVQRILASAYQHPDVQQKDIQYLLWGVIAGAHIKDMRPQAQAAAAALLSAQDISDLNGGVAGLVPTQLSSRAIRKLPRAVREAYETQQRLRQVAAHPGSDYGDLEAIAVKRGEAPASDDDIPAGRWSWHPDGYFVRYDSHAYSKTTVEIVMPEHSTITRDALGRITEWKFSNGDRVRTTYTEGEPATSSIYPSAKAYRFASIEIRAFDAASNSFKTTRRENVGWTFVETGDGRRGDASPARGVRYASLASDFASSVPLALLQSGEIVVIDLNEIRERAEAARERQEFYEERIRRATEPPSRQDLDNMFDMDHYGDGVEAAFGGPSDRAEWLIDHFERQNRALAYATNLIASLGEDDGEEESPPAYEPSSEAALPSGSGYLQRRGVSGRSY